MFQKHTYLKGISEGGQAERVLGLGQTGPGVDAIGVPAEAQAERDLLGITPDIVSHLSEQHLWLCVCVCVRSLSLSLFLSLFFSKYSFFCCFVSFSSCVSVPFACVCSCVGVCERVCV